MKRLLVVALLAAFMGAARRGAGDEHAVLGDQG
jgi:hypothetical protein